MNRNQVIKLAKDKIKKRLESRMVNNYFVFWKGKEDKEIPDRSLVIVLTEYPIDLTETTE